MRPTNYDFVFVGLSLSSSWGNGHATTYRALLRGLAALGKRVLFLERDVPWYAEHRDLPDPDFCDLILYDELGDLDRFADIARSAKAVIVGSYVPEGRQVIDRIARWDVPYLAFYDIDTPVTLAAMRRGEDEFIAPRQVERFDAYLSFSGGRILRELEKDFGAQQAFAFYCSVDAARYRPMEAAKRWDMGYLGTYSDDRQPALERLLIEPARRLPQMRFVVAGSSYPANIDWPDNVERIEHLPPEDHPRFYAEQRYTLNVTRQDMIAAGWSPSVRLFEAAACGTPIISDRWEGLDELFGAGRAIEIADSTADVVEALSGPEHRARGQAELARRIVLDGHTGEARARGLLAIVQSDGQEEERRQLQAVGG